jgi:hypothetical protein
VSEARGLDRARHQVENADWLNALARVGRVARGASFALVAILAIKLAVQSGGKAISRQGALQSLAPQAFGKSLLVLLALGFAAYALWRFAQTFFDRTTSATARRALPSARATSVAGRSMRSSFTRRSRSSPAQAQQSQTQRRTRRPRPCSPGRTRGRPTACLGQLAGLSSDCERIRETRVGSRLGADFSGGAGRTGSPR